MSNVSGASNIAFNYSSTGAGDSSWMAALAKALAKVMTDLQKRMVKDGKEMSSKDKTTANNAKSDLQVASQEYGLVVNAINTVLKSVGEANSTLARKQ